MSLRKESQEKVRRYFRYIGKCLELIEEETLDGFGIENKFSKAIKGQFELYRLSLEDKMREEILRSLDRCFFEDSRAAGGIPNFVDYLRTFGEVQLTQEGLSYVNKGMILDNEGPSSYGLFLNKRYVGCVDFYDSEIWFKGNVPEIQGKILMIYRYGEVGEEGIREDNWKVPFP